MIIVLRHEIVMQVNAGGVRVETATSETAANQGIMASNAERRIVMQGKNQARLKAGSPQRMPATLRLTRR